MVRIFFLFMILAPVFSAEGNYSVAEVAGHKSAASCWLIVDDRVYDITRYLKKHMEYEYDLARHCGTDASKLWHKKPRTGEEHSRKAERLLERYRIGGLRK